MNTLRNTWNRFQNDESGQDLIEYALIAGLVGLVASAAIPALTTSITGLFTKIETALNAA